MTAHLLEVGPHSVRRLCCGGGRVDDEDAERAAFEGIDDQVGLVDLQPIAVAVLWQNVFASLDCGTTGPVTVVHPSWWSPARVAVIAEAAQTVAGTAEIRPRSWLLGQASASLGEPEVVEIADDIIVVTGATVIAETRCAELQLDAETITDSVVAMVSATPETVVIDAPPTVDGAAALAAVIARRLSGFGALNVVIVNDLLLRKLVGQLVTPVGATTTSSMRSIPGLLTSAVLLVGVFLGMAVWQRHVEPRGSEHLPTTFVVEGRLALEVPAQWQMRRIIAGPGSARVQITSPTDPDVAIHATRSRVASTSLGATAEFLKGAIDVAPAGVFVDFNPAGHSAGRPAVTYREIRSGHDIRWTVWVDKTVRISIGCQSRTDHAELVRQACDLAVRTARAMD